MTWVPAGLRNLLVGAALLLGTGALQDVMHGLCVDGISFIPEAPPLLGLTVNPLVIQRLLGTRLLFADLIWLDTFIKADTLHERQPFTAVYRAFKTVVKLDPDNILAYYVAGTYLSVIKDDIKGATAILRDGAQYIQTHPYSWSEAWRLPFTLGYNLLWEEQEVEEGAKWIRMAVLLPHAPLSAKRLAEKVSTERGRLEVAARVLNEIFRTTSGSEAKARVEAKMLDVASRQELLDLNESFEVFLRSSGAYAFSKKRQFEAFFRSNGHSKFDLLGRPLGFDQLGKIIPISK